MLKVKFLSLALTLSFFSLVNGQATFNMSNTTVNTCDGLIYDDGGPGGDYTETDYTMTICADSGTDLYFVLNSLMLGSAFNGDEDIFIIYDGTGTGGPVLFDSQVNTAPTGITSSSGCITLEIQTDPHFFSTDPGGGFELLVSCTVPETCSDGILNNGEVQIDCGGPNCTPCYNITDCGEVIVNGDFETIDAFGCANNTDSEIHSNATSVDGWFGTTEEAGPQGGITPDYWTISGCGITPNITGSVGPCNSGQGALGFFPAREEVQSQLGEPLIAGQEYCLTVDVAASNSGATSDLMFWFHNETFANGTGIYDLVADNGGAVNIVTGPIGAVPQIVNDPGNVFTNTCTPFTSSFCATGGEQYVVVGGSYATGLAYLIIDNLSVKQACPLSFDSQITASGVPDCAGSCVDLYVETSNQGGGCEVTNDFTFQWYENGVLMAGETNDTLLSVCPTATTTYSVEITYSAGCMTYTKLENETTITFNCGGCVPPTVVATVTDEGCVGANDGEIDFSITGSSTYDIIIDGNVEFDDVSSGNHVWTNQGDGTYAVQVVDINDPSCDTTFNVTINPGTTPTAPTFTQVADICSGDPLSPLPTTSNNGITGTWSPALDNTTTTLYTFTPDAGQCSNTETMTITVNTAPVITNEASTDITDCVNPDGTITITANGTSYELFDASNNSITTNATGAFTGLNAGDYYVIVTLNGCTSTSSNFTISNASAPTAPVAGADATYCDGDLIADLTATAGAGGTLTWYDDAPLTNNIGTGSPFTPGTAVGTTTYYVTETVAGCESPATAVTITINPIPAAPAAGTDATYCLGDALADMTATAGSGGTLNWYDDAGLLNNIGTGTTHAPNNTVGATTYYVTESLGTCVSIASTVTITINDAPTITSEVATDLTDCVTPNGTITITSNGTSYELFDSGNNSLATNTTGAFTGLGAGDYYVVVSDGNCTTTGATLTITDQTQSSSSTQNAQACSGTVYTFADGTQQTITGNTSYVSTLTNSVGCDSLVTENITVVQASTTIIDTTICEGTDYTSQGDAANFVNVLADFQHTSVLTGASGCDSTIIENITVIPAPTLDLGPDFTGCLGETITIQSNISSGTILWSTGETTSSISVTLTADVSIYATVTDQCGTSTDTINITVLSAPVIDAGPDVTLPLGATADLEVTSSTSPISYQWSPSLYLSCDNCPDPTTSPTGNIIYIVSGTDENGCVGYDTINITIDGEISVYIPNVFSPNGDGENDQFQVYGPSWSTYSMQIFNRWGAIIWESEDPNVQWDGKTKNGEECPQAVFVYKFRGISIVGQSFERSGNVMLTR